MQPTFQVRERSKARRREQGSLRLERKLWKKGYKRVACLDEAGRGPLAGPVVAAAVMVKKFPISNFQFSNIKDSKKLSAKRREEFYKVLTNPPAGGLQIEWGIARASEKIIDRINILEATKLAMKKAVNKIQKLSPAKRGEVGDKAKPQRSSKFKINYLILDGNFKINSPIPQKSIIKADEKVFSCACASILAKVWRDRIMMRYHRKYPKYRFDKHKGYPTKLHLKLLKKYGPCKIHRKSFGPVLKSVKRKA